MSRSVCFSAVFVILVLGGCKIQIQVPEGGIVQTTSGEFSCSSGEICTIDVSDILFDQTFIATPAGGFVFKQWKKQSKGFCGNSANSCRLVTKDFGSLPSLFSFLSKDTVFFLTPIFEISISGGGEGPDFSKDVYIKRPVTETYDFENNGQVDGVQTFSYDSSGRLIRSHYLYSGDGTDDQYEFRFKNVKEEVSEFTYDVSGRLVDLDSSTQHLQSTPPFGASKRFTFHYEYSGDELSKNTQVLYDEDGGMASRTFFTFTYSAGRVVSAFYENDDTVLNIGVNAALVMRSDLSYNANGELEKIVYVNYLDEVLQVQNYEWNDMQLLSHQNISNDGSANHRGFHDYSYDAKGCMVSDSSGLTNGSGVASSSYTSTYLYSGGVNSGSEEDDGGDGSVDGSRTVTTENENFIPPYFPDVFPDIRWSIRATNCENLK